MIREAPTNGRTTTTHGPSKGRSNTPRAEGWGPTLLAGARAFSTKLIAEARQRPYVALSIAAGVGFVLGGGLSTRAGRLALLGTVECAIRELTLMSRSA
jgi:hypothetical protein